MRCQPNALQRLPGSSARHLVVHCALQGAFQRLPIVSLGHSAEIADGMLQAALSLLSRMLHCSPGVFGFAGTKDKRAVSGHVLHRNAQESAMPAVLGCHACRAEC